MCLSRFLGHMWYTVLLVDYRFSNTVIVWYLKTTVFGQKSFPFNGVRCTLHLTADTALELFHDI